MSEPSVNDRQASQPQWQVGDASSPSLDQLINAFIEARDKADWLEIAQLNDHTQACVESELQSAKQQAVANGVDPAEAIVALKPKLERLADLYQSLQQQCTDERDAVAEQLGAINAGRAGAKQYVSTSSL